MLYTMLCGIQIGLAGMFPADAQNNPNANNPNPPR